jgi:hypothetical protein
MCIRIYPVYPKARIDLPIRFQNQLSWLRKRNMQRMRQKERQGQLFAFQLQIRLPILQNGMSGTGHLLRHEKYRHEQSQRLCMQKLPGTGKEVQYQFRQLRIIRRSIYL